MIEKVVIQNEEVFMKKGLGGWRVVYPYKTDGKWNWKNLLLGGSWANFMKWMIGFALLGFIMWSYKHDMANCLQYATDVMRITCDYNNSLPSFNWSSYG
jgi:hypothetical protein